MKNSEIANTLKKLAEVYGAVPDGTPLQPPMFTVFAHSKEEITAVMRAVGGKFTKKLGYGGDTMTFESERIPKFDIHVNRDKICRKIPARYECEPLLSPEEEAQIMEASA